MENKKKTFILLAVLAAVLLLAGLAYNLLGDRFAGDQLAAQPTAQPDGSTAGGVPEDIPAADFTVYDADGNEVRLSDYFGKPIVLNFWASWCGPCKMEMPDFAAKNKELDGAVQFLMINMTDGQRETIETATAFMEDNDLDLPYFFDTESEAAMTYGAYALPTTYFINADGNVIARAQGAIDAATLQQGIDMIYTPAE